MASIARFDDFYASALFEEKMKGAVNKCLPIEYKRSMSNARRKEKVESGDGDSPRASAES